MDLSTITVLWVTNFENVEYPLAVYGLKSGSVEVVEVVGVAIDAIAYLLRCPSGGGGSGLWAEEQRKMCEMPMVGLGSLLRTPANFLIFNERLDYINPKFVADLIKAIFNSRMLHLLYNSSSQFSAFRSFVSPTRQCSLRTRRRWPMLTSAKYEGSPNWGHRWLNSITVWRIEGRATPSMPMAKTINERIAHCRGPT
jgi:hypothetical protein